MSQQLGQEQRFTGDVTVEFRLGRNRPRRRIHTLVISDPRLAACTSRGHAKRIGRNVARGVLRKIYGNSFSFAGVTPHEVNSDS